ncbi:MAG: PRC-barrel domain-containing protein [Alphaproteobacteria bacterium]|nr:PRC-barrel domain-containing protein [Alphaproteobacteria bacterium]
MLKKLMLTTALAAVIALPVVAQTSTAPTMASNPTAPLPPAANSSQIDGNKLIGQSIQNAADNKTIGKVDSVILGADGKVDRVVVGVGGFIGIGKKDVAIAWSDVQVTDNGRKVTMNTTKDALKAMPEYKWPKDQKHGSVYRTTAATTSSGSPASNPPVTGTADTVRR